MQRILDALRREPVRTALYPVVIAVLGALCVFGVIDAEMKDALVAAAGFAFAVGATETARRKVTPTAKAEATDPLIGRH